MKKILALLLAAVFCLSFAACGGDDSKGANKNAGTNTTIEESKEPEKVMANKHAKIDGIYVDSSYVDDNSDVLKMVYVFLTLTPETNDSISCKYVDMIIGENTYDSDHYKGICDYMPSYYYSSYNEDIYTGTEFKIALTYKIPQADLEGGKAVTMEDDDIAVNDFVFTTDEFVFCDSVEAVGELADPTGYADIANKKAPADKATTNKVRGLINDYYWTFYVSAGTSTLKYEIEFSAPNKFEVRTSLGSNGGTYDVRNGYIFATYNSNNHTVEIPYEFKDGDIELDLNKAFSIYE